MPRQEVCLLRVRLITWGSGLVQRTAIAVDSVIKSDQNEKSGHEGSYCILTALVLAYVLGYDHTKCW